jgi:hypothetical protein
MRKAFKVVTVFTGTAACAAAFAPAAGAATVTVKPTTTHKNCSLGPKTTSMVFWWPASANHGPTCVGGYGDPGYTTNLDTYYSSFCAGDNYGSVFIKGRPDVSFGPGTGTYNLDYAYVMGVYIASWSGAHTNTCST